MEDEDDTSLQNDILNGDENSFDYEHNSSKVRTNTKDRQSNGGPKHKVTEDLQSLIISNNPQNNIQFTYSQRMNTQMEVSGYLLKKKRGPYTASSGLRTINWKCEVGGCPYSALTLEGTLKENRAKQHNHEKKPELFAKKEAKYKLFKKIAERGVDSTMSHFVQKETKPDILENIGSLDALKQAANRYKRKRIQEDLAVEDVLMEDEVEGDTVELE